MERKRAWITAGVVAVTFTTSALAVMANTGLLAIAPSARDVGQLTPSDIAIAPLQRSTKTSPVLAPTVRYEDVYVTVPADGTAPQPETTLAPVARSKTAGPVAKRRNAPTPVEHELGETHEGEDDDD